MGYDLVTYNFVHRYVEPAKQNAIEDLLDTMLRWFFFF